MPPNTVTVNTNTFTITVTNGTPGFVNTTAPAGATVVSVAGPQGPPGGTAGSGYATPFYHSTVEFANFATPLPGTVSNQPFLGYATPLGWVFTGYATPIVPATPIGWIFAGYATPYGAVSSSNFTGYATPYGSATPIGRIFNGYATPYGPSSGVAFNGFATPLTPITYADNTIQSTAFQGYATPVGSAGGAYTAGQPLTIYGDSPTLIGGLTDATNLAGLGAITSAGNYIYSLAYTAGIFGVTDVTNAATPVLIGTLTNQTQLGGANMVRVAGNYAYVASRTNARFSVIDISNPKVPTLVGALTDATNLANNYGVAVQGSVVYVTGQSSNRITAIDVADPSNPKVISSLQDATNLSNACGLYVVGKYAYVACFSGNRLGIIDISDPTNMVAVSSITDARLNGSNSVYVVDRYAYVAVQSAGRITVVDVSNPAIPAIVGTLPDPRLGSAYEIKVANNLAYLACGNNYFTVVDVSNVATPVITGSIGPDATNLSNADTFVLLNGYAFVGAYGNNKLTSIQLKSFNAGVGSFGNVRSTDVDVINDVSVGRNFSVSGTANFGSNLAATGKVVAPSFRQGASATAGPIVGTVTDATNLSQVAAVVAQGRYVYTVSYNNGVVSVIDVSRPQAPVIVGTVTNLTNFAACNSIVISGNYLYVPGRTNARFTIVDVSNPSAPTIVGSITDATNLANNYGVQVVGSTAFVTCQSANRITAIDVSDPTNPTIISSLLDATNLAAPCGFHIVGKYAYISIFTGSRITVVDISNPAAMTVVGTIQDGTNLPGPTALFALGRYVYVAGQTGRRMTVVDVKNIATPLIVGTVQGTTTQLNNPYMVKVAGNYAYINAKGSSSTTGEFTIIDVSNPAAPTILSSTGDNVNLYGCIAADIQGGYAYVGSWFSNRLTIISLDTLSSATASIGNIQSDDISVTDDIHVGNRGFFGSSIDAGSVRSRGRVTTAFLRLGSAATPGYVPVADAAGNLTLQAPPAGSKTFNTVHTFAVGGMLSTPLSLATPGAWPGTIPPFYISKNAAQTVGLKKAFGIVGYGVAATPVTARLTVNGFDIGVPYIMNITPTVQTFQSATPYTLVEGDRIDLTLATPTLSGSSANLTVTVVLEHVV